MRYAFAIATVLLASGCFGGGSNSAGDDGCAPHGSTASAGNSQLTSQANGSGYNRTIVIHAKDKASGAPVKGAKVAIYGEMTCPHLMGLVEKNLHESPPGTYSGQYIFVMPGEWSVNIIFRTKKGDATTSSIPVTVRSGR